MDIRQLSDIAAAVRGRMAGDDVVVSSVVLDSRAVRPGALFAALAGNRLDGHDFVGDALARGAAAVLVRRSFGDARRPAVLVDDPRTALLDLASNERGRLRAMVVGITGSTGKTSTKDLTAAVLRSRYRVHASPGSFNNEIGVPLTILGAAPGTGALVCEIGAGAVGEIAALARLARPDVGIVTNVGLAHVETFGSPADIRRAKAELIQALRQDGMAILNADDPVVAGYARHARGRLVTFGTAPGADVQASAIRLTRDLRPTFTLTAGRRGTTVELAIHGRHMVWNALAASACGFALGISIETCAAALRRARIGPGRMEVRWSAEGIRVVHDAYNANPTSVAAALRAARELADGSRCIAVLGPMAELGKLSRREHLRIGALAARLGIDRLVTVGQAARAVADGAIRCGMKPVHASSADGQEEALALLLPLARSGDLILIKASRAARLERLVDALIPEVGRSSGGPGQQVLPR
jgi:UDP-N-acetylmuramoyl-tripeptide--D-alanyl-D-alanine ligase